MACDIKERLLFHWKQQHWFSFLKRMINLSSYMYPSHHILNKMSPVKKLACIFQGHQEVCLSAELGHNAAPLWQTRFPHGVRQPPGQRGPTDAIHLLGTALQWSLCRMINGTPCYGWLRALRELPGVRLRLSAGEPTNPARMLWKPGIMKLARLKSQNKSTLPN